MATEEESVFASLTTVGKLNKADSEAYLERINLPASLLSEPPSLPLLRKLQYAHLTSVPFDSSRLHIPENEFETPEAVVELRRGAAYELGRAAFDRIVKQRRGGYCFVLNSTFAGLLRNWFLVGENAGKVYGAVRQDPAVAGWSWGPVSHEVLAVGWEGEPERYMVDVGFGDVLRRIALKDGATSDSTNPSDCYVLRHESLPLPPTASASLLHPDPAKYFIIYRWSTSLPLANPSDASSGFWTPLYAFQLQTVLAADFVVMNHYNSTHLSAAFTTLLVVSRLNEKDGSRTTLQYRVPGEKDEDGKTFAQLLTTGGKDAKQNEPQWIDMKTGPIKEVLVRDFGFKF
ncbi:hypothetical protein MNV49_000295 [Pseudohyphozyma bogoriensis]|nr:hypothetical protein MNV49_000295 [Pseudohyphozyma bogoriensis]